MKTLTSTVAVLTCLIAVSTATAQNSIQVVPQPVQPPPTGGFFLGVYTSTVLLPHFGPVPHVALSQNGPQNPNPPQLQVQPSISVQPHIQVQPRVMPHPGPAPQQYGQRVNQVVPGSSAARAGLEPGDILVTANRVRLHCRTDLVRAINQSGGHLMLNVIDVRTGSVTRLAAYPDAQGGPVFMSR
ncbi:MAG: PDZ domain-containing protein [Planctomycetota bacterium]